MTYIVILKTSQVVSSASGTMTVELFEYPSSWRGSIFCSDNDYHFTTHPGKCWPELLEPYVAICVSSPQTECIMQDIYHKINCIDRRLKVGLLSGLCLCVNVDPRVVGKFLAVGADPNTRCFFGPRNNSVLEGGNALHFAVHRRHFAVADVLVDVVADPNAKTARGKTALDLIPN